MGGGRDGWMEGWREGGEGRECAGVSQPVGVAARVQKRNNTEMENSSNSREVGR